jgi:hypothetical protein
MARRSYPAPLVEHTETGLCTYVSRHTSAAPLVRSHRSAACSSALPAAAPSEALFDRECVDYDARLRRLAQELRVRVVGRTTISDILYSPRPPRMIR